MYRYEVLLISSLWHSEKWYHGNKNWTFDLMTGGNAENRAHLKGYEDMMDGFISTKSEAELLAWASRQVYIAQDCACVCRAQGLSSCPGRLWSGKVRKNHSVFQQIKKYQWWFLSDTAQKIQNFDQKCASQKQELFHGNPIILI